MLLLIIIVLVVKVIFFLTLTNLVEDEVFFQQDQTCLLDKVELNISQQKVIEKIFSIIVIFVVVYSDLTKISKSFFFYFSNSNTNIVSFAVAPEICGND